MQSVTSSQERTRQVVPRLITPSSTGTSVVDATEYYHSQHRAHSTSNSTGYEDSHVSSEADNPNSLDDSDLTDIDGDVQSVASGQSSSASFPNAGGPSALTPASPFDSSLSISSSYRDQSDAQNSSPFVQTRGKSDITSAEPVARRTPCPRSATTNANSGYYYSDGENGGHGKHPPPSNVGSVEAAVDSSASQPTVKDEAPDNSWRKGWLRDGGKTAPAPESSARVELNKPVPSISRLSPKVLRSSHRARDTSTKSNPATDEQADPTYGEKMGSSTKKSSFGKNSKQHKKLECPNGCGIAFGREGDLSRHLLYSATCSGGSAKAFPCEQCNKNFSRSDALKRHKRVRHGHT